MGSWEVSERDDLGSLSETSYVAEVWMELRLSWPKAGVQRGQWWGLVGLAGKATEARYKHWKQHSELGPTLFDRLSHDATKDERLNPFGVPIKPLALDGNLR